MLTIQNNKTVTYDNQKSPQRAAGIFYGLLRQTLPVASTSSATNDKLLISVEIRFERAVNGNTDIVGLLLREFGQLNANLREVQTGHFFVQMLGQAIDAHLVRIGPQLNLSQRLVGKRVAHHERGVAGGTTQID